MKGVYSFWDAWLKKGENALVFVCVFAGEMKDIGHMIVCEWECKKKQQQMNVPRSERKCQK